jgi:photosystem II stability/assembly factor-like uncharacterized protein
VFKTTDGGQTWAAVNNGLPVAGEHVTGLAIDPANPSTLYVGTSDGKIFRSTDGAVIWTALVPQ